MKESDVRAVTLFFLFAFADESTALSASAEAVRRLRGKKFAETDLIEPSLIVSVTYEVWMKFKRKVRRARGAPMHSRHWSLPEGMDFAPWRDFQKTAPEDELLSVIWGRILGISELEIAKGLGLTDGTVRYRLGRAFRKLGARL